MRSVVHANGWISVDVGPRQEDFAKETRAERDRRYGNIFPENETDARWVGELGEMTFRSWLRCRGVPETDVEWILDDVAGRPDFIVFGVSVGAKTVKRKVRPRDGYTAQVTAQHANEPVENFFFLTYEFRRRIMWLLGGIAREAFMAGATLYRDGEWVHPHYQVRGHDIYNAPIALLTPPDRWLQAIRGK